MKRIIRVLKVVLLVLMALAVVGSVWLWLHPSRAKQVTAPVPVGPVTASDLMNGRGNLNIIMGWQGADLRRADFSQYTATDIDDLNFSTQTRWPATSHLPAGFDPKSLLEIGKDPGLGITELHRQGITGKGVSVAVIDNPMRQGHQEFGNRLRYTLIDPTNKNAGWIHFHGAATASILGGKTVGVAPESSIYFYALPGSLGNFNEIAAAIDQILALNEALPEEQRVRVISISMGMSDPIFQAAIKKAEAAGIAVVHCGEWFPVLYTVAGAEPGRDRNDPAAYRPGMLIAPNKQPGRLWVPADFRTTASSDGPDVYAYWGKGGMSWAAPWLAGVITLGMQVNPDLTPAQAYTALEDTATDIGDGVKVVNPAGFIERVKHQ